MKFSMIFEAQILDTSRKREFEIMHECVEQAVLGEEVGFDGIWAVEHHSLKWYAHMSAPETFLAYVAGKTSRIRIGHGVVCLPHRMNHPIKVAERVAMLDILSNGRVDFGIGKGGTEQETGAFQTPLEEVPAQLEESARIIPKMWSCDEFSYESERLKIPPRPIHPKPRQDPHPPMFLACTREATLNQAGEWGLGALCMGFGGPEDVAQKNRVYRAAVKRRTPESQIPDFPNVHLSALCPAIVLDDGLEARRIGHRGQRFFRRGHPPLVPIRPAARDSPGRRRRRRNSGAAARSSLHFSTKRRSRPVPRPPGFSIPITPMAPYRMPSATVKNWQRPAPTRSCSSCRWAACPRMWRCRRSETWASRFFPGSARPSVPGPRARNRLFEGHPRPRAATLDSSTRRRLTPRSP